MTRKGVVMSRVALLMAVVVLLLAGSASALAAAPESQRAAQIALSVEKKDTSTGAPVLSLSARLLDSNRPLGNQAVEFFVAASFFGERPVKIGSGVTNATGTAVISYQPKWEGAHNITARFPGNDGYSAAETSQVFQVSGPVGQYTPQNKTGLEPVGSAMLALMGLVLVVVWGLLLLVFRRSILGIARVNGKHQVEEPVPGSYDPARQPVHQG